MKYVLQPYRHVESYNSRPLFLIEELTTSHRLGCDNEGQTIVSEVVGMGGLPGEECLLLDDTL